MTAALTVAAKPGKVLRAATATKTGLRAVKVRATTHAMIHGPKYLAALDDPLSLNPFIQKGCSAFGVDHGEVIAKLNEQQEARLSQLRRSPRPEIRARAQRVGYKPGERRAVEHNRADGTTNASLRRQQQQKLEVYASRRRFHPEQNSLPKFLRREIAVGRVK